jgi:hypothetical protein
MKLGTQVRRYDGTILLKIQINIFKRVKKAIEVFSRGFPPRLAEGFVLYRLYVTKASSADGNGSK